MTAGASALAASLNSPVLVSASGVATAALLPALEQSIIIGDIPLRVVKLFNALTYFLNFFAAQQPGRIDGSRQEEFEGKETKNEKEDKQLIQTVSSRRGRTLLVPSGWAFVIWAPIFLGELLFVVSSALLVKESSPVSDVLKKTSGGFIMAQLFQSLWTVAFRPKYITVAGGSGIFISVGMLSGTAWALSRAHAGYVGTSGSYSLAEYLLYFLPISLHFGWGAAATLVNANGSIAAFRENVSPRVLAWSAHLSAVAAAGLSVWVSVTRRAPVVSGVITWALVACTTGLQKRLEEQQEKNGKNKNQPIIKVGTRVQKWLSTIGAGVSGAAALRAVVAVLRKD